MIREGDAERAKAWAFDMGYTVEELESAWASLKETNKIITNLDGHGHQWFNLPNHLIDDLIKRYGEQTCEPE